MQSLANPNYLHFLAQRGFMKDPAFIHYLAYLTYWREPAYVSFLKFPVCLHFLELLQHEAFRKEVHLHLHTCTPAHLHTCTPAHLHTYRLARSFSNYVRLQLQSKLVFNNLARVQ